MTRKRRKRGGSANVCGNCGKSIPFSLPGYMRISKGEDGIWRPMDGICKCDPEMYKFCVLDLAEKKNRKGGKGS